MKKNELIECIKEVIKKGNKICRENAGLVHNRPLERLKKALYELQFGELDAIEYRDIFEIEGENEAKSYKELGRAQGTSFRTIKGIRQLYISLYNKANDYRGEYIHIN